MLATIVLMLGRHAKNIMNWSVNAKGELKVGFNSFCVIIYPEGFMMKLRLIYCVATIALLFFAISGLGVGQPPTLSASPLVVSPGDKITVSYSGAPGFNTDWIAIYRLGASNRDYGEWSYLQGKKERDIDLHRPS